MMANKLSALGGMDGCSTIEWPACGVIGIDALRRVCASCPDQGPAARTKLSHCRDSVLSPYNICISETRPFCVAKEITFPCLNTTPFNCACSSKESVNKYGSLTIIENCE